MAKGDLREKMPITAALIDDLRSAFGKAYIDGIIRNGIGGKPVFFSSENGHAVGTPLLQGTRVAKDERGTPCILVLPDGTRQKQIVDGGRRQK